MIGNRGASNNDGGELCWSEAVPSNPLKFMGTSERDDQEADRVLSGELLKLSFDERNKINEEMHGVRDDFPEFKEHPEATELSLLDMDCEIESILLDSEKNKCAGLQLEHIPTNREFRLAFLRCELHDATKAAHRLVRYIRLIRERCSCRGLMCNVNVAPFSLHPGAIVELNYKIMTFGIHPAMLPVTDTGIIKTRNHVKWLEARENIEKDPYGSKKTTATGGVMVECPGMNDVLFNRGKYCQHHPGNVTFRSMLESKKQRHMIANQTAKKEIAWEIMEEVENRNGKFFYWDKSGWWVEFENRTEIRHKVATSLRDFNKQARAIKNCQNTPSSTNAFRNQEARKRKRQEGTGSSSDCSCGL